MPEQQGKINTKILGTTVTAFVTVTVAARVGVLKNWQSLAIGLWCLQCLWS